MFCQTNIYKQKEIDVYYTIYTYIDRIEYIIVAYGISTGSGMGNLNTNSLFLWTIFTFSHSFSSILKIKSHIVRSRYKIWIILRILKFSMCNGADGDLLLRQSITYNTHFRALNRIGILWTCGIYYIIVRIY